MGAFLDFFRFDVWISLHTDLGRAQPPFASRPKTETTAGPRNSETLNPQPQSCETEPLPLRHPARKGFLGWFKVWGLTPQTLKHQNTKTLKP